MALEDTGNIKDGFNRIARGGNALSDRLGLSDQNIHLTTTGRDGASFYEVIGRGDVLDSLQKAGVKHLFIEPPDNIQNEDLIRLTDGAMKRGIAVHIPDHLRLSQQQRFGGMPETVINALGAARQDFMSRHGIDDPKQLQDYVADPANRAVYEREFIQYMQDNKPDAYNDYLGRMREQQQETSEKMAGYINDTAGDEKYAALYRARHARDGGGLTDMDNKTTIEIYGDRLQQERFEDNPQFRGGREPDFKFFAAENELYAPESPATPARHQSTAPVANMGS